MSADGWNQSAGAGTTELGAETRASEAQRRVRTWFPAVLVVVFWVFQVAIKQLDLPIYAGFFSVMGSAALLILAFSAWWLTSGGGRFRNRFLIFALLIAIAILGGALADQSIGPIGMILFGIPAAISLAVVWLVIARKRTIAARRTGLIAAFALACGAQTVIRVNGVDGDQQASLSWRWTTTAEDKYLASRVSSGNRADLPRDGIKNAPSVIVARPGDWTDFRGADRRGEVRGLKIATDWESKPPQMVWRQRIGPAWSSMLVIDKKLFTQEQRGEAEAVVCLDADSGREVWAHLDQKARFFDGQAGAGPRATPTFSNGRIFTFGGTGILNCLDAATGEKKWSRNVVEDSGAPLPMWGFSNSPLVVDGVVIAYAGGKGGERGLLAYRETTGEPAWSAATGPVSYSSPQLMSCGGQRQVLFLSDTGLAGLDPTTGILLWEHKAPGHSSWRVALPQQIDRNAVLVGCEDLGFVRLDLARDDQAWRSSRQWDSRALRPAYNDFVSLDGFVYGFDESFLACVDAATGKRRWKAGRYGHGQMLLLTDQKLLAVISESGEAVLVSARPDKHAELGRFQAVDGKTWNHPAIAHGRLYVRNAEEIACYKLGLVP